MTTDSDIIAAQAAEKWSLRLQTWLGSPDRSPVRGLVLTLLEVSIPFAPLAAGLLNVGSPLVNGILPSLRNDVSELTALLNDPAGMALIQDALEREQAANHSD